MNRKRLLVIGLLGLFMISMFAGVVSAAGEEGSILDRFTDGGSAFLSGSFQEGTQQLISKIGLMFLVTLLVYSVSGSLPFLKEDGKSGLKWAISITVAILSFIFVNAADLRLLITNYEALGIALTSVIPLIILMIFAEKLNDDSPGIGAIVTKPLYIIFSLYLLWKWISIKTSGLGIIYGITAAVSIAWLFFGPMISRIMKRGERIAARKVAISKLKKSDAFVADNAAAQTEREKGESDDDLDKRVGGNK